MIHFLKIPPYDPTLKVQNWESIHWTKITNIFQGCKFLAPAAAAAHRQKKGHEIINFFSIVLSLFRIKFCGILFEIRVQNVLRFLMKKN